MKIAFFEIKEWEENYLKQSFGENDVLFFREEICKEILPSIEDVEILSVFIYSKIDKKILFKMKNLKVIITRSMGFDHIDLKECKKRKIKVLNVPHYGENTVAEHTFALILALSRKIPESYERTVRGNFSLDGLEGFDLKGKKIGIIGIGSIGKHVARISKGFEMKIIAFDVFKDKKIERKFGLKYVSLNKLLKEADIVTIHCPYTKKTHHLINKKNIKLMKESAILVNTARGGIVETGALVGALARKKINGAALDVLEEEVIIKEEIQLLSKNFPKEHLQNLLENHLLLTFNNVIITPHNAFNSKEALERILDTTLYNIKQVLNKKIVKNLV